MIIVINNPFTNKKINSTLSLTFLKETLFYERKSKVYKKLFVFKESQYLYLTYIVTVTKTILKKELV